MKCPLQNVHSKKSKGIFNDLYSNMQKINKQLSNVQENDYTLDYSNYIIIHEIIYAPNLLKFWNSKPVLFPYISSKTVCFVRETDVSIWATHNCTSKKNHISDKSYDLNFNIMFTALLALNN